MRFDLVRPCADCPFRNDHHAYLNTARAREIVEALDRSTFACHKTTVEGRDGELRESKDSQHCAGAIILQEKAGHVGQMLRIAERLGIYDHTRLDMTASVFDTAAEFIAAQPKR